MSKLGLLKGGEFQPVSLGDLALLALTFLAVCTTFALEEGLSLWLPDARTAAKAGRSDLVIIRSVGGSLEIGGRPASADMVRPAVERALAADSRAIVVLETGAGANHAEVVGMLESIKLARAPRVVLRERTR